MLRLGLFGKTVLLLVALFAIAALGVHQLYVPYLEDRTNEQLLSLSGEQLDLTEDLMHARAGHLAESNRRALLDLPFELTAGDPDRTRVQVDEYAKGLGTKWRESVDALTGEFLVRTGERTRKEAAGSAEDFGGSVVTGLLLLLGAVLLLSGAALARTVLLPVARLLRATERVSEGHLSETVGLTSRDEVGRLGRAFDRMTDSLRSSREEIEALNRTLQDKVREKTQALEDRNRELAETNETLLGTIEELKATRNALVHSEKMASVGRLAGGVAHEFNNLLGGIIGCAEDATAEEDPEEAREGLDMILRTARRACNITENLLRFSRPPDRIQRETDLAALVGEAIDLVRPEARSREVELRPNLEAETTAWVDGGQIHQVVLNLLTNALNAVGREGAVDVEVRSDGGKAVVVVTDTGVGIPEGNLSRIFEPFFTTRAGDKEGTGLGLSVSYSIVEAHGGRIEVESRPGEGARFTVRLPGGDGRKGD